MRRKKSEKNGTITKVMAHCGVASRRKSEELIQAGRVTVNGKKVTELGIKVTPSDKIEVDGVPIYQEQPVYYLFYKPKMSFQLFQMIKIAQLLMTTLQEYLNVFSQ